MQPHEDPGNQLVMLAQAYLSQHPSCTFSEALKAVRSTEQGALLAHHYVAQSAGLTYAQAAMKVCPACDGPGSCRIAKHAA